MCQRLLPDQSADRKEAEAFQQRHKTGLVTLLFIDIVDFTEIKAQWGDRIGLELVQKHQAFVWELLARFPESQEINSAGDSTFVVFVRPLARDPVLGGIEAGLRELSAEFEIEARGWIDILIDEVFFPEG